MLEIDQFELTVEDLNKTTFPKEGIFIPESDYGLAEIYLTGGEYEVCEIPMYGGKPQCKIISGRTAEEVVKEVHSWT